MAPQLMTVTSSPSRVTAAEQMPPFVIPYSDGVCATLPTVARYQYLGVWLERTLSPDAQVAHMIAKCGSVAEMLSRIQTTDGAPSFTTVRTLTLATLLPRMTYGLPFVIPTERQYARLNALLFRPLVRALGLPHTVHRAGLAVYTGVPIVEVQRDRMLASLFASSLMLARHADMAGASLRHPAYWLAKQCCTRAAITAAIAKHTAAHKSADRLLAMHPLSLASQFAVIAKRWSLMSALPEDSEALADAASAQQWATTTPLRAHIKTAAAVAMRERWLQEVRGCRWSHRFPSTVAARPTSSDAASARPRGVHLPPLLGVDPALLALDRDMPLFAADSHALLDGHSPMPSLAMDDARIAKLRARVALNRASFHAVRHQLDKRAHSADPRVAAAVPLACRHVGCVSVPITPESTTHVLSSCSLHSTARAALLAKLGAVVARLRERAALVSPDAPLSRVMDDAPQGALLHHLVCASPLLMCNLTASHRTALIRHTGEFLAAIASLRPV